jgi:hypothetical protein
MKRLAAIALLSLAGTAIAIAADVDERVAASRAAAQTFGMNLKAELQAALKAGGPMNGLAVCNQNAVDIAEATSKDLHLSIGRTSLKVRNPNNAADAWERATLTQFEARKAGGEPIAGLEHYEVTDSQGQLTFRYMKAIPTAKVCLACHGDTLVPELETRLDELYPEDQARGFKEGDIRGAFTISKPM